MAHTRISTRRGIQLRNGKRMHGKVFEKPSVRSCASDTASTASNDSFDAVFKICRQKVTRSGLVLKRSVAHTDRSPKKVTFAIEEKKQTKKTLAPVVQQFRVPISDSEIRGLGPIVSRRLGRKAQPLF